MKRFLKRFFLTLVVIVACCCLLFWWLMRRTVPEHAVRIPADAPVVLTLNLRALGLDVLLGGSLAPDTVKRKEEPREDDGLRKAIEDNDGTGVSWRKDVLCFLQNDTAGKPGCAGAVIVLSDAEKFHSLASGYLAKRFGNKVLKDGALHVLYGDSLGVLLGWNEDELVVLKKFQGDSAFISGEMKKIFALQEANSILSNADFRAHQLENFDAGLWVNMKQSRLADRLENYGLPAENLRTADYLHLLLQFKDGEMRLLQKNIAGNAARKVAADPEPLLLHAPATLSAFWSGFLPRENEFAQSPLGHWLSENTGEAKKWRETLSGNFSLALHDTVKYHRTYVTFDYDENFEQTQVTRSVPEMMPGVTACFPVKKRAELEALMSAWKEKDSLQVWKGALRLPGDLPFYMKVQDSLLVLSTHPEKPLKLQARNALDAKGTAVRAFADLPKLCAAVPQDSLSPEMRRSVEKWQRLSRELTFSGSVVQGGTILNEVRLSFANKNVNALVQLMEIMKREF